MGVILTVVFFICFVVDRDSEGVEDTKGIYVCAGLYQGWL